MGIRAAFVCGTVLSVATVSVWSWTANATIGPAAPVHLSRNLRADYAALASGPTGNGIALFAVVSLIFAVCFAVSGLRSARREAAERRERERAYADAEAAEHAAGWR